MILNGKNPTLMVCRHNICFWWHDLKALGDDKGYKLLEPLSDVQSYFENKLKAKTKYYLITFLFVHINI